MDIKVNIVELASELANDRVYEQLTAEYIDESTVYKTDSKIVEYTEFGQKLFDGWYDYYYKFINVYKID